MTMTTILDIDKAQRREARERKASLCRLDQARKVLKGSLKQYNRHRMRVDTMSNELLSYRNDPELVKVLCRKMEQTYLLQVFFLFLLTIGLLELRFVFPGLVEGEYLTVQGIAKVSGLPKQWWIVGGLGLLLMMVTGLMVILKTYVPSPITAWKEWQDSRTIVIERPNDSFEVQQARVRNYKAVTALRFSLLATLTYLGVVGFLLQKNVEIGKVYLEQFERLQELQAQSERDRQSMVDALFSESPAVSSEATPNPPSILESREKPKASHISNPRVTITVAIFFLHLLLFALPVKFNSLIELKNQLGSSGCSGRALDQVQRRLERHKECLDRATQEIRDLLKRHEGDDFVWSSLYATVPSELHRDNRSAAEVTGNP